MDAKSIAEKLGTSRQHVYFILSGERRPSPEKAGELEKITGVDRRAWLWPDEFHNPMLKRSSVNA